jgi:hypothetical protein
LHLLLFFPQEINLLIVVYNVKFSIITSLHKNLAIFKNPCYNNNYKENTLKKSADVTQTHTERAYCRQVGELKKALRSCILRFALEWSRGNTATIEPRYGSAVTFL